MEPSGLLWTRLLVVVATSVCVVRGEPIVSSDINCVEGSSFELGPVNEEYTGVVEVVNSIAPGKSVKLVPYIFPAHLDFLELSFTVGETTATVRTRKPLDADVLTNSDSTLYYSVMCDGDGVIKYNNTRTLKLSDINDNSPVFQQKSYDITISETQQVNTEVLRVTAVDGDSTEANKKLTYSIAPASDTFSVTSSGAFMLNKLLDYNTVNNYSFTVKAEDNGGLSDTASVQISVTDYDNLNPLFSHSQYQAVIQENDSGPLSNIQPEAINAQDGDTGINTTLTYSISAVSPDKYRPNFNIDPNSGVVTVVKALDREEMTSSLISVSVKVAQNDNSLKTADCMVFVTVEDQNDNQPQFDSSEYSVELLENAPVKAVLFRAYVTDQDQGGFVGTLRIVPESSPFSIGTDGTVTVKDSAALDRETTSTLNFQIEAVEKEPPNTVITAQVSVTLLDENDNSPSFSSSEYEGKVFADQTIGMLLVEVKAEDPDADVNGQIKYSIDFGNNDGYFSIDENTGSISLAKLVPFEENRILEFQLYVKATDGGVISRSSSAQVTIRAPGDFRPQFLQTRYSGTVEEGQNPGAVITRVSFLALPSELPLTLEVTSERDKFSISNTGEVTTLKELDFDEDQQSYSVKISITDGVTVDEAVVEVHVTDINDNPPVFASDSITELVPENVTEGSNVTEVSATDKDSGFNKEIRYSLRGDEGRFSIDPRSGMVSVAAALDRETKAEYNLLVFAEDQGRPARTASATLTVKLTDVNDHVPAFSKAEFQHEVLESEPVDATLLTLSAEDPDEGENGRITFSILEQSPSSDPAVFELDSSSGTLRLVQTLDYSKVKVYSLRVQATDGGTPPLAGESVVKVNVKDVNNNPPEFSKNTYDVAVPENLPSGASILTLEVTDGDESGFLSGSFIYTSDTFDINKQGVLSLRKDVTLDRETTDSYVLQVVAVDQPSDGLSSTAQVNVLVLDYNDNTPQFPVIPDPLEIPEGLYTEEKPGDVYTIVPTDADLGVNGEVTLSLSTPHPLFRLTEDGKLLAVGDLDRESRETYELVVKASDKGSPQRENFATVTVRLVDVNDNAPEFSSSVYERSLVVKDAVKGQVLLTLSATDRDSGDNSLVTYSVVSEPSSYLAVNSETGNVTLTSDLSDLKEDTTEVLKVMAEDHGDPALSSTASVIVHLEMVSLVRGVTFESSSYNFSLSENQPSGTPVGAVRALAGSSIYSVTYSLKTESQLFSIDASGAIVTKSPLDREKQEWYFLEVEAVDNRTTPTSATAVARVQVEDVNEAPQFPPDGYKASVFSITPYKTPLVYVKASDPDVGDQAQLVYSLSANSPHFDVDPTSGLVYVVSAAGADGQTVLEVKATDPKNLQATTRVEVSVQGSVSSDVVVISLNQPVHVVEKKIPALEKSLGEALGWTVNIIEVRSSNGGAADSRSLRSTATTLVSFIALNGGVVVPSEEVAQKLKSQADAIRSELIKLFGNGADYDIEVKPAASNQTMLIVLGVLLGLSLLGLVITSGLFIWFKRKNKHKDSDKECFNIPRHNESYTNPSTSRRSSQEKKRSEDKKNDLTDSEDEGSNTSQF